jgi:hypothetical protein
MGLARSRYMLLPGQQMLNSSSGQLLFLDMGTPFSKAALFLDSAM